MRLASWDRYSLRRDHSRQVNGIIAPPHLKHCAACGLQSCFVLMWETHIVKWKPITECLCGYSGQADTKHSVLQRWILRLNSFHWRDFECIYTPGKGNVVCDALSRYPQLTTKYDLKNETLIEPLCVIAEGDSHRICRDCENKYPLVQHKPIANGKAWEVHCVGKRHVTATDMAVTDVMLITSTKLTAEEPLVLVQGPAKQLWVWNMHHFAREVQI